MSISSIPKDRRSYVGKQFEGNQDRVLIVGCDKYIALCVFDGHGDNKVVLENGSQIESGSFYAEQAKLYIEAELLKNMEEKKTWNPNQWKSFLAELIQNAHIHLQTCLPPRYHFDKNKNFVVDTQNHNSYVGGGTSATVAVALFFENNRYIVCAHVGDSDAYIFTKEKLPGIGKNYLKLTDADHSPSSIEEYKRVNETVHPDIKGSFVYNSPPNYFPIFKGNYINQYPPNCGPNTRTGLQNYQKFSPENVGTYFSYNVDGQNMLLGMTRSLADFGAHNAGALSIPHVSLVNLGDLKGVQLIVASDGLWDTVLIDDFCTRVNSKLDVSAQEIYESVKEIDFPKAFIKQHDDLSISILQIPDIVVYNSRYGKRKLSLRRKNKHKSKTTKSKSKKSKSKSKK